MNPSCNRPRSMNSSSTKMVQKPWKMRGSNSKMLQILLKWHLPLQNAANSKAELFVFGCFLFCPFSLLFAAFWSGRCHFNSICSIFEFEPLIFHGICTILVLELFIGFLLALVLGFFNIGFKVGVCLGSI